MIWWESSTQWRDRGRPGGRTLTLVTIGTPESAPEPLAQLIYIPPAGPRRTPAWLPWVVTPLLVLMLGSALDAVDMVAPDVAGGTAARYVPPEGQRTVTVDGEGTQIVTEQTRSIGIEGAFAAPSTIAATILGSLGETELREAQWWRASRVNERGERGSDLFLLSAEGVTQVATWGGEIGFVFDPAIVLLPAEVRPGDTWSSRGDALPGGLLTYTADFTALRADGPFTDFEGREIPLTGGCLGIESNVIIENVGEGISTTLAESTVWCPGRGSVWSSGTVDGQPTGSAEVRPGALAAEPPTAAPVETWSEAVDKTSALLLGQDLALMIADPFFGSSDVTGQYPVAPSATVDGRLVTVNERGDDVQVWNLDTASAVLSWFGHPGGTVVSVATVGDLVIATTSRRQVVAYDSIGRRLWSWAADELVISPAIAAPSSDGTPPDIVAAARSGTVTRLDAVTGTARWSRSIGADARATPVVVDGLVLVADERERLTALDAATGAIVWQREVGLVTRLAADARSSVVVTMLESGEVIALELDDGVGRWSISYRGLAHGLVVTGDTVVIATDEATTAVTARNGALRWRSTGADAIVGDGDAAVVAVVHPGRVELRAVDTGALIEDRLAASATSASGGAALAVGASIVVFEAGGFLRRWEVQ